MGKIYSSQFQFNGGEISPRASGRVNDPAYQQGFEDSNNFIVTPYGSVTSRPGTKHIGSAISNSIASRFKRFIISNANSYVLEFSNNKLRFLKEGALIQSGQTIAGGDFTSSINTTYWTDTSSGTGSSVWNATSGGVARITGAGGGNEGRLQYRISNPGIGTYTIQCDVATTNLAYKIGTTSNASDIATGTVNIGTAQTFSFTATSNNSVIYITFEQSGSAISDLDNVSFINDPAYTLYQPYSAAQLQEIDMAQYGSSAYIVHPNVAPYLLTWTADNSWAFSTATFTDGPYLDVNTTTTTITPSGISGSVTLTASASTFVSSDVGRLIRIKSGPDLNDRLTYAGTGTKKMFDITFFPQGQSDVAVYLVDDSAGTATLQAYTTEYTISTNQVVMVTAPSSTQRLVIQPVNAGAGEWGYATITGYTSATQVTATVNRAWHGTNATTSWALGAFRSANYPSAVEFHEQRLWFLTDNQTLYGSVVYNYSSFKPDNELNKGTPSAASAVTLGIAGAAGEKGRWILSHRALLVGTDKKVHIVQSAEGLGISAVSLPSVSKQSETSTSAVKPVLNGNFAIFSNGQNNRVFSFDYNFDANGYLSKNISLLSEQFFRQYNIQKIVRQEFPDDITWILRSDGKLISLVFNPAGQQIAFTKHSLGGTDVVVESIEGIPNSTGTTDMYFAVARTINGSTVRYLERFAPQFLNTSLENAVFTDSSLTYSGSSATIITGLSHLNGETVSVLADGNVRSNAVVSGGSITISPAASTVTVGLYSNRSLTTNRISYQSPMGSAEPVLKSVYGAVLDFFETLGCVVGYSSSNTDPINFASSGTAVIQTTDLFTGLKEIDVEAAYDKETQLYIAQTDPLPITINAITTKFRTSDR